MARGRMRIFSRGRSNALSHRLKSPEPPRAAWGGTGEALREKLRGHARTGRPLGEAGLVKRLEGFTGRRLYRSKCILCHRNTGSRGPNLFKSELGDERFLETVINGRKGTSMPAFGLRMSPDDVWAVHAFVKTTDRY